MERPGDEQRLEEQAGEALAVSVEAEGVHAVEILRDVARKDGDEERGGPQLMGTRCLGSAMRLAPMSSSATPDTTTTVSSDRGNAFGTWARKLLAARTSGG